MRPVLTAVVASILLTTQAIAQEPWPRDDVDFVPEQLVDVLYADGYYEAARGMCAFCLSLKSTPTEARSHVRFIDAECCRLQGQYVAAAIKFRALLEETPTHPRRKEITERLFDIANYWINDTREEMREYEKTGEPRTGWAMIRGLIRPGSGNADRERRRNGRSRCSRPSARARQAVVLSGREGDVLLGDDLLFPQAIRRGRRTLRATVSGNARQRIRREGDEAGTHLPNDQN